MVDFSSETLPAGRYKQLRVNARKIHHPKRKQKRAGAAILILAKIDFNIGTVNQSKEEHYIIIKGLF